MFRDDASQQAMLLDLVGEWMVIGAAPALTFRLAADTRFRHPVIPRRWSGVCSILATSLVALFHYRNMLVGVRIVKHIPRALNRRAPSRDKRVRPTALAAAVTAIDSSGGYALGFMELTHAVAGRRGAAARRLAAC